MQHYPCCSGLSSLQIGICGRHCLTSEVLLANVLLKHRRARRESILVAFFSSYFPLLWENKMAETSGSRMRGCHAYGLDYVTAKIGGFPCKGVASVFVLFSSDRVDKRIHIHVHKQQPTQRQEKEGHSAIP